MSLLRYPYTNLHELNLDWIIEQLGKEGNVISVNGKSGIVTLTGEDINKSPNSAETVAAALTSQGQSIQTVRTQIGVTPLPTIAQTLTGAIAENAQEIADIEDNIIGDTPMGTTANTVTGAIAEHENDITALNNRLAKTYTNITEFYDNRCENIGSGESTVIFKTGNVYICSIAVNFLVTPTTAQTSIITLPAGIPSPSVQTWGVVYNRTSGNTHTCSVSTSGNINVINRGSISAGDKVEGQIVWIA